jgi:hypothetical protein
VKRVSGFGSIVFDKRDAGVDDFKGHVCVRRGHCVW